MRAVYIIADSDGNCKIGISRNPTSRYQTIQNATHRRLSLMHAIYFKGDGAAKVELAVHHDLAQSRRVGEWFLITPDAALAAILRVAAEIGVRPAEGRNDDKWASGARGPLLRAANARNRLLSIIRSARSIDDLNVPGYSICEVSSTPGRFLIKSQARMSAEFQVRGDALSLVELYEAP